MLCFLAAFTVQAHSTTWKGGAADPNWSMSGNWSGGIPTATSDVVFFTNGVVLNSASYNVVSANITILNNGFVSLMPK
jgi:hypothetical protein